jgi:hypothetical protein
MPKDQQYRIIVPRALDKRLRQLAAQDGRSSRNLIHQLIKDTAMAHHDHDRPARNAPYQARAGHEPDRPDKAHAAHNPSAGVPHGPEQTCPACEKDGTNG